MLDKSGSWTLKICSIHAKDFHENLTEWSLIRAFHFCSLDLDFLLHVDMLKK